MRRWVALAWALAVMAGTARAADEAEGIEFFEDKFAPFWWTIATHAIAGKAPRSKEACC